MSRILEKLADQHEERIINVLYQLENDIINEVTRATKGQLVSQRLAIQLQPRLRTIIQNTFLNEADLIINEEYNKVAKEVVDVQSLNMNQREAERFFRRYKGFEVKQDFERLYEIRERKHQVESNNIF